MRKSRKKLQAHAWGGWYSVEQPWRCGTCQQLD